MSKGKNVVDQLPLNLDSKVYCDPKKRHDAVMIFDCLDGNPNGDPDLGNQPRTDIDTGHGLVTDACIKRKIRNYVLHRGLEINPDIYKIFIQDGAVLNDAIKGAYENLKIKPSGKGGKSGSVEEQLKVQKAMQEQFFDIRMFGAVLSTGLKAGQVWGPLQVSFARSIDPITLQGFTVTRCAVTSKDEEKDKDKDNKTMGRKELMSYGVYKFNIFYNPHLSDMVTSEDLELFWEALIKSWDFDRSSGRGVIAPRGLWIFSHENKWGNAPASSLFEMINIEKLVETPRKFADYQIICDDNLPVGISLSRLI